MAKLPDFFIVGAAKCGTTSLYRYLKNHPDVFMPGVKEPNFFSYEEIEAQNLYYKKKNIKDFKEYLSLFADAKRGQKTGEASVSYLFYPGVPYKIRELIPDAKILISLRNPADRAFSHYLMDLKLGYAEVDFEDVVFKKKTDHRLFGLYYQQYVELGFYYNQVKRYFDVFGKDNVLVLLTEDMAGRPAETFKTVCDFLGVSRFDGVDFKRFNTYSEPANIFVKFAYSVDFFKKIARRLIPGEKMRDYLKSKLFKPKKVSLSPSVREFLVNLYREDIQRLESLISRDLSRWYL